MADIIGCEIIRRVSVDSTNLLARKLAAEGAAHGTAIVADEQTGGVGRQGRKWSSPSGLNIYLSVVLRPGELPLLVSSPGLVPLCAGLAVARALNGTEGIQVALKWPNDLICLDKKLGGILLEARTPAGGSPFAALGVGINVNSHADDFAPEIKDIATSMSMVTGRHHHREEIIRSILKQMQDEFEGLRDGDGVARMLQDYKKLCSTIGKAVRAIMPQGEVQGTATGLDASGRLIVRSEQQEHALSSADIIHLR